MPSMRHRAVRALGHQFWLPKRMGLAYRLSRPDRMPDERFATPFFGVNYSGSLRNPIDWHVYMQGGHALDELALLAELALRNEPDFAFYDVGANIGHHSLFMAPRCAQVLSFEPYAPVYEELLRKIEAAHLDNVRAFNLALGQEAREARFDPPTADNPGIGSFCREPAPETDAPSLRIERGDDIIRTHSLPPIGILKIDVEGFESEVLGGLGAAIARDQPAILFELWHPNKSGFRSLEHMRELTYPTGTLFRVLSRGRGYQLVPFAFTDAAENAEVLALPPGERYAGFLQRGELA